MIGERLNAAINDQIKMLFELTSMDRYSEAIEDGMEFAP